ncbi:alpha,alpha-trehalase [Sarracenia purpurea var. burkii]
MELTIAFLANVTGDSMTTAHFLEAAQARQQAMNSVFWNAEMGQWLDYWLSNPTTCKHLIVEGLVRSGSKQARSMAEDIAVRWIRTNFVAFKKSGAMHEKYDVEKCGEFGGGGEYIAQTGFGWSNGVVLAFLEEFGWPKDLKIDC